MGKKDKQKKGKGTEKTSKKTQHKLEKRILKVEKESGEQSIEELLADFKKEQDKLKEVTVVPSAPPSPRSHFTFTASPDTNELFLFGGEYFDGKMITMFSDLFVYHCKTLNWNHISSPTTPPPRSGHQAVYVKTNAVPSSICIFGGEYASPTQVRFHHYKDLWFLRVRSRRWEQIQAQGGTGPCARSGHRMLFWRNSILLFGGFSDTGRKTIYFNDLWTFDLSSLHWTAVRLTGDAPTPRSACQFFPGVDMKTVYIFGGYRKDVVSKDLEKGVACSDHFRIVFEKEVATAHSCNLRVSGARPKPPRIAMSGAVNGANSVLLFGGVHDVESEDGESVIGHFHNDLFFVELDKARWHNFSYATLKQKTAIEPEPTNSGDKMDTNHAADVRPRVDPPSQLAHDVFTLTLGSETKTINPISNKDDVTTLILPPPRSSPGFAIIGSTCYVYGGVFEIGDRKLTLDDFYCLDLSRPTSWQCLYGGTQTNQEWYGSDSDDDDEDESGGMDVEEDTDDSSTDEELVEEAPVILSNETFTDYWNRTQSFWCDLVNKGLGQHSEHSEDSATPSLDTLGQRLAKDFYQTNTGKKS